MQFSSDLDDTTKRQLHYGQGLMRLLRQEQYHPYSQHQQVILLTAALDHAFADVPGGGYRQDRPCAAGHGRDHIAGALPEDRPHRTGIGRRSESHIGAGGKP